MRRRSRRRWRGAQAGCAFALLLTSALLARPLHAYEVYFGQDRGLQVHGAYEMQLRTLSDDYHQGRFYLSQFSHIFDLELEMDIAPDGFAIFDNISGFVRLEGRIECVFKHVCGFDNSYNLYGNGANQQPRNFTNGSSSGYAGTTPTPDGSQRVHHPSGELVAFTEIPPFDRLFSLGANPDVVAQITENFKDAGFAVRKWNNDGSRGPGNLPQGPWQTSFNLQSVGTLAGVPSFTNPGDPDLDDDDHRGALLLRPWLPNLYEPSDALAREAKNFDSFDQQFSENDLFVNHGASQDEWELKEAYLDLEMFDSRLWLRLGKQSIVWGKTELFRTTDQLNPQDIAISSLPSLEESRISLWSARGVWSFYDVGPFQDVRLEGAVILDDFEPVDLGFCGEPYTPFLVCGKNIGLFAHGISGTGLAGEERPPNFYDDLSGLEFGVRLEWRWDRFSFALVDFWGYNDAPYLETFNLYSRSVDPKTGRPLDSRGHGYDTSGIGDPTVPDIEYLQLRNEADFVGDDALAAEYQGYVDSRDKLRKQAQNYQTGNRQLFDLVCGFTVGIAGTLIDNDAVQKACVLDLVNNVTDLGLTPGIPTSAADGLSMILAGSGAGSLLINILGQGTEDNPITLFRLNQDLNDRPPGFNPVNPPNCTRFRPFSNPDSPCLSDYLTDEQEALLGCGPFYGTNCDSAGIDLFNAEFSVLGQRLPNVEPGMPVATRVVYRNGRRRTIVLPGARPLTDPRWDPRVDGCLRLDPALGGSPRLNPKERLCTDPRDNDLYSMGFDSELEALSENFVTLLAALGAVGAGNEVTTPGSPNYGCSVNAPQNCELVRAVVGLSGVQRPEVSARRNSSFGRRDFLYQGGGEAVLKYDKHNVLGFSMDFAEDVSKTNWSFEITWIPDERFSSLKVARGYEDLDVYNLTISADRPTFINFLNANRTFFFNTQWFFRYIDDFKQDRYLVNGPWGVLGTFTAATGYFQDRMFPSVTVVYDVMSASGGVITQVGYRYTENFSISFGVATFFGKPRRQPISEYPLSIGNNAPPYEQRTSYQGLSAIAERDELFMRLRYTF